MTDLSIDGTQSTPTIRSFRDKGLLTIEGDSYPENTFDLFGPVIAWVESFLAAPEAALALDLRLIYLNTSSIKALMDIFDLLEAAHERHRTVCVKWYYDSRNERVAELAEEFKEDCTFPFDILPDQE